MTWVCCVFLSAIIYPVVDVAAQCSEPDLEESQILGSSELDLVSSEEALSRGPGDWALTDHVSGGLSPTRFARALTLDLLGRLPEPEELEALQAQGGILDEALLDEWLASDAFAKQMQRLVRSQLWNNISNLNLYITNVGLSRTADIYWRRNPALRYRGDRVPCLDEPATFDDQGDVVMSAQPDGTQREGWVWVNPYWDPSTSVKVCAIDAQTAEFSSNGARCGTNGGTNRVDCGCGEGLKWCITGQVRAEITRSLAESLDRLVEYVFTEEQSFLSLFESRRFFINGPLVHFFKHHLNLSRYTLSPSPIPDWQLPNLEYSEGDVWTQMILDGEHSGVLTHPAFLLRFQTNRARASRFFDTFLCSPFQPPEGGLPVADEASVRNPDLQERAGCKYCHAMLEPAASFWGRWTEQGVAYLNPEAFPAAREDCMNCALNGTQCSAECRAHYLTTTLSDQEVPYLGMLKSYSFRRDEHHINVERGPRLLAYTEIAGQRLPRCVAQRMSEWLLGRELSDSIAGERDREWLDLLGLRFARSGYDYRQLIKDIVTDERYRRVK